MDKESVRVEEMVKSKVELVAKTVPLIEGVTTANFTAYVARIGKVKDNPEKLVKYLVDHKHWSPLEHTSFTFKIRTSRAIGRELLRHRSFVFQELSQRYEPVMEFEPIELRAQADKNRQSSNEATDPIISFGKGGEEMPASVILELELNRILYIYEQMLAAGVARECARMILPECTATTILMTGNLRSWIHFLAIRDEGAAQKEMQAVAKDIKALLLSEVPGLITKE